MNSSSLVTIGIVTWNSACELEECFNSIGCQNYDNLELIVVDNASTDLTLKIIQTSELKILVICNEKNNGYCGAHNQAIHNSQGKFYLALNPDVILEPDYISAAVGVAENDHCIGMVSTKLLLSPKSSVCKIDSTGLFIDRRRRQYLRGFGEIDNGQYDKQEEVFGVDGAAPLYRRAMLEDIKIDGQYFDEAFFAHKEDIDLSWRARIMGWKCVYTPHAVAYHKRTFKPGKRQLISDDIKLHAVKNRYLLLIKNESQVGWKRDWLQILWYDLKILAYLLVYERSSLKAFSLVRKNWKRARQWREQIRQKKRATDEEILKWFKAQ